MRPSRVGKAILLTVALLLFFAIRSPVLIGPVATLLILGLGDGGVAWWRLRRLVIDITPLRSVAAPPDALSCSVAVSNCSAAVVITFRAQDSAAARVLVEPGSAPTRASLRYPRPHRRNYLDYRVVISTVGLAVARRDELIVVDGGLFQGPPPADIDRLEPPLAPLEPELERLREYVPGDRWSRISWSTLARTGALHVRQEDPVVQELVVVVDLRPSVGAPFTTSTDVAAQLTRTLSLAASIVDQKLDRETPVRLVTYEPPPEVFEFELAIAARRTDGRQPVPSVVATGATGSVVNELVADRTELSRRLAVADVGSINPLPPAPYVRVSRRGVDFVR